jgi:hypothetical protein
MVVPAATPVTVAVVLVALPIVATVGALLLHVQPGVPDVNVVVAPGHTVNVPAVITLGVAPTVATTVLLQLPTVYVMMEVPEVPTAANKPLLEPIVSTVGAPLVQAPPVIDELNVDVPPVHSNIVPEIVPAPVVTVTVVAVAQPVLNV